MYKYLLFAIAFLPAITLGQVEYSPLIDGGGLETDSIGAYINSLYLLSVSVAGLLAVIKLIIAGAKYMLSDVITTQGEAKKEIQNALLGLLLVISAVLILTIINPALISNNFELERVKDTDTSPTTERGAGIGAGTQVNNPTGSSSGNATASTQQNASGNNVTTYDFSVSTDGLSRQAAIGNKRNECESKYGDFTITSNQSATCTFPKSYTVFRSSGSQTGGRGNSRARAAELNAFRESCAGTIVDGNGFSGVADGVCVIR